MADVIIVGAGLAGLACARYLASRQVDCLIVEASDGVGGRVRTDLIEGFQLDRGFQVLLTAYPEAKAVLDYEALKLHSFTPGALVQFEGGRYLLSDPWREPTHAIEAIFSPIGTLADKLRVARMRYQAMGNRKTPETTTLEYLQRQGFSPSFISKFFQPFFGGIFLESQLCTSSQMAQFVFRMMASGDTALPANGMGAISKQLASGLPLKLNSRVKAINPTSIVLDSGEQLQARAIVLAADGPEAARLAGLPPPDSRSVSCLYFAADRAPIEEPILLLNGDRKGPVNNLCVPSAVASTYAPAGAALVSATVLGLNPDESAVREQLTSWFGNDVRTWRHLKTYQIAHAQPEPGMLTFPAGLHVCGDHCETASIQGALVSGRRAAESVMRTL